VPLSALEGDNVATQSANMPWYSGPTLLEVLETVEIVAWSKASRCASRCSTLTVRTSISAVSPAPCLPAA
jgi:sulfate adenylyltransferase subunit 1 (EFTu-like GTPase family)